MWRSPSDPEGPDEVHITVDKSTGVKCERCWRYVPAVRTELTLAIPATSRVEALAEPVNR